ncbi:MAG TPA: thiamine phosphate synthase [Vicinamibacterales bacterium]|nr:thiamine phosphate synthase [Vicinamibacterales bacterium]
MTRLAAPAICLVTDRRLVAPDARTLAREILELERWLDEALEADLDLIQLRERDLEARVLLEVSARLVARRGNRRPRIVINDRTDVALASGAGGVHLRSDGPPVPAVRSLTGASLLIGRSIHSDLEARQHDAADYLLFGAVFKVKAPEQGRRWPAQGLDALVRAVRASRAPVLAIGGVTLDNASAVREAGAAGVAAIGLFLPPGRQSGALGPSRAAAALRSALGSSGTVANARSPWNH